jgi:aspartyl-tRNA(Asn)/glutamyl-tRNA(Gln) amidotransferase subunit A
VTETRTIADLTRAFATRTVTSESVTRECLARIDRIGAATNAFITVLADRALAAARAADAEVAAGRLRGSLHGVPISLKDIIDVAGVPTTAASAVRRDHVAAHDAVIVQRLERAGAVIIGKTNLHEFALGPTNDESAFGPVHHPLDPSLSSGGSSGGSAVSVATGMSWASIGTDTGGSIRIPAAACGVVGLKPSFGDVPTDGVVPLSVSFDHVGPLCRSVADARLLFDVLSSVPDVAGPEPVPQAGAVRLGTPRDYFLEHLAPAVRAAFEQACDRLRDAGVTLDTVSIPAARETSPIYVYVALAEAAEYHARTIEAHPDRYTTPIRVRLQAGRHILAEDYLRAQRGRQRLVAEVDAALAGCDALLLPTLPVTAQPIGAATVRLGDWEDAIRTTMLRLTQLFNVTGHPALTMPMPPTTEGLPVGLQLVGRRGATRRLLDLAALVEPIAGHPFAC